MTKNSKKILLTASGFVLSIVTFAQTPGGSTALSKVTTEVNKYIGPAVKLLYVIAAIVGIVGAIQVYSKWQAGDPNTTKLAASWFGAAIFICLVGVILGQMFLGSTIQAS